MAAIAAAMSAHDRRRGIFMARYSTVATDDSREGTMSSSSAVTARSAVSTVSGPPVTRVPLWINGPAAASNSARSGAVTTPATGEVIRSVPFANAADVDVAVRAAAAAFPAWRDMPAVRRARILNKFRELIERNQKELAALISEEHGKVFLDAMGSIQRGIEVVGFAVGAPELLQGVVSAQVV